MTSQTTDPAEFLPRRRPSQERSRRRFDEILRAARALAAFDGAVAVGDAQLRQVAPFALGHRLRRNPLDEAGSAMRVARAIEETLVA